MVERKWNENKHNHSDTSSSRCLFYVFFVAFFFRSQEHVTPHIGLTVEPITISRDEFRSRKLEDPMYNLEDEATLAIGRVAALGDFEKAMIEVSSTILFVGQTLRSCSAKYQYACIVL